MKRGSYKEISDKILIVLLIISIFVSVIGTLTIYFHVNGVNLTTGSVITNKNIEKQTDFGQVGVVIGKDNGKKGS